MMKRYALVALAALAAPALAQEAATTKPAETAAAPAVKVTADTVVATVNGTEITLGQMIVLREGLPQQYQSLPDDVLFKGILDQLVQQVALDQTMAGKLNRHDVIAVENQRRGMVSGIALRAVVDGAVTEEALKAAYDERFKGAVAQTEWNASHILVDSEQKAKDLKAQIDGGADFAELAKTNSSDGAAANGGSLGWFGKGMMVKPFEDAVATMKAGEVSGPIQTQFGWHLVKLNETRTAAQPTLDELREELAGQIEQKAAETYVNDLIAKSSVTKPGEGIDPATLRDATLLAD